MRRVSKEALYGAFEKEGFNSTRAARICDKTSSYFSNCETCGINSEVAKKLKDLLGIDIETLPEPEPDQAVKDQIDMFEKQALSRLTREDIAEAVFTGVYNALEKFYEGTD